MKLSDSVDLEELASLPLGSHERWVKTLVAAVAMCRSGEMKIMYRKGGVGPFVPNREQNDFYDKIIKTAMRGEPIRLILLKGRQIGMSTATAALVYAIVSLAVGMNALTAAHEEPSSRHIWSIYQRFKRHDPRGDGRPKVTKDSHKEMVFGEIESSIGVNVADEEIGRAKTLHIFHGSEVAMWKGDVEAALSNLMSTFDYETPHTIIILESTGKSGTEFERRFREADDNPEGEWKAVFYPWFWDETKYIEPNEYEYADLLGTDDPDERELLRMEIEPGKYVQPGHLKWRRKTIRDVYGGNVHLFKINNPATVNEAFDAKSTGFFNSDALAYLRKRAGSPEGEYRFELSSDLKWYRRYRQPEGVRIYRAPDSAHEYVLSADAGLGKSGVAESALTVIDAETGALAASWAEKINPHSFADICAAIGYYYNTALLVPENNNHGKTLCERLHTEIRYPKIHRSETVGMVWKNSTEAIGFKTDASTKPLILDKLARLIIEQRIDIPDVAIIDQMARFSMTSSGRLARKRSNDDLVMALAIGVFVASKSKMWSIKDARAADKIHAGLVFDPIVYTKRKPPWEKYKTLYGNSSPRRKRWRN